MSFSNLQIVAPGMSYNAAVGQNWSATVLDMSAGGVPAGAHPEVSIPVRVFTNMGGVDPAGVSAVTLGAPVTKGIAYRPLTVTDRDGTRVYNLPSTGDLLPHLCLTDANGHIQTWQPFFPRFLVGAITTFIFTP